MSLSRRLILYALLAMLPVAGVILYLERELRAAREQEVTQDVTRQTQRAASELQRLLDGMRTMLVSIAAAPPVSIEDGSCASYLASITSRLPQVYTIAIFDPQGNLRCRDKPVSTPRNVADRAYFRQFAAATDFQVGLYTVSRLTGAAVLPMGLPVRDANGGLTAVVVASLDLGYLGKVVADWKLAPGSSLTVADRDGVILARNTLPERFVGTAIPAPYQSWVRGDRPGVEEVTSQDGTVRVLSYIPAAVSPAARLYISSGYDKNAAFAAVNAARRQSFLIIALGFACAAAAAYVAGRVFVRRPVTSLIEIADGWRAGVRAPADALPGGREFAEIGAALDRMGSDLERRQKLLEVVIRSAPNPLLLLAEDGEVMEASDSWWAISGHPPTRCAGEWVRSALGRDRDRSDDPVVNPFLVTDGQSVRGQERDVAAADGRTLHWEFAIVPLGRLPDGRALRLLAAADVTERRNAALRQETLVAELNHRVKNTLAVVQSIGTQTAKSTSDPADFNTKFALRIASLARTHDLLTRRSWGEIPLRDMLRAELEHADPSARVELAGPDISIPADFAVSLCLITHEMATNALKYGALSHSDGKLRVEWAASEDAAGRSIHLSWMELCPVPVSPPLHRGFGSRLIERTASAVGTASMDWRATGLHFSLTLTLPALQHAGAA